MTGLVQLLCVLGGLACLVSSFATGAFNGASLLGIALFAVAGILARREGAHR